MSLVVISKVNGRSVSRSTSCMRRSKYDSFIPTLQQHLRQLGNHERSSYYPVSHRQDLHQTNDVFSQRVHRHSEKLSLFCWARLSQVAGPIVFRPLEPSVGCFCSRESTILSLILEGCVFGGNRRVRAKTAIFTPVTTAAYCNPQHVLTVKLHPRTTRSTFGVDPRHERTAIGDQILSGAYSYSM